MALADYAGRTIDVAAFQGWSVPLTGLEQALASRGESGVVLAGEAKLAQRFLLLLLTVQGSVSYRPGYGCRFMRDALAGSWRTVADVLQSYYFSLVDIQRQLAAEQQPDDPDDSKLASAEVTNVLLTQDRVALAIQLVTVAGVSRRLLVPLSIVPG